MTSYTELKDFFPKLTINLYIYSSIQYELYLSFSLIQVTTMFNIKKENYSAGVCPIFHLSAFHDHMQDIFTLNTNLRKLLLVEHKMFRLYHLFDCLTI